MTGFPAPDSDARRQERYDTAARLLQEGMVEYAAEVLPKMIAPGTIREQPEVALSYKYATRYSPNYSREYGAYYTQLSSYNLRGSDSYGRRDFVPGNQRAERAHYVRYSDYQSGKYATSLQVNY